MKNEISPINEYVLTYSYHGVTHVQEVVGFRNACEVFRYLKKLYGDTVRMSQVIINYGGDIL